MEDKWDVKWDIDHETEPNHANFTVVTTTRKALYIDGKPIDECKEKFLEEVRVFYFDRWNWESNDQNDRDIFEEIDKELEYRRTGSKPRPLTATWTMEAQQDAMSVWGFDLEKEIVNAIAEELKIEEDERLKEQLKQIFKQ